MPQFPDFDPIDDLIAARFPQIRMSAERHLRKLALQSDSAAQELREAIAAYRRELEALPPDELESRVQAERKRRAAAENLKREREERARSFNQPQARADFGHWAKKSYWTLDECAALSLGRDPRVVSWQTIKPFTKISEFAAGYAEQLDTLQRAKAMGQLWDQTTPSTFLAWAKRMRLDVPADLVGAVEALGIQIADWKSLHDEQKRMADTAQEEVLAAMSARTADLEAHNAALDDFAAKRDELFSGYAAIIDQRNAQIAELSAELDELRSSPAVPSEKPLTTRERDSVLKMILAMAIKGYGYDPTATRTSTAKEISDDAQLTGLSIDEDTVRKYLNEARQLLPRDEAE